MELGGYDISFPKLSQTDDDQSVGVMMRDFGYRPAESGRLSLADGVHSSVNGEQLAQPCAVIAQFGHVGHSYRDMSSLLKNGRDDVTGYVLLDVRRWYHRRLGRARDLAHLRFRLVGTIYAAWTRSFTMLTHDGGHLAILRVRHRGRRPDVV